MERLWKAADDAPRACECGVVHEPEKGGVMASGTSPGVETKVAAGGYVTIASGLIAGFLVTYVFKDLPPDLKALVPVLTASVLGSAAAWMAKHTPRAEEVIYEVEKQLGEAAAARQAMTADEYLRMARAVPPASSSPAAPPPPALPAA